MGDGYYGDFLTWFLDEDVEGKIFHVWFKEKSNDPQKCLMGYFSQIIELPDGDILIGFRDINRIDKTLIVYFRLSEISFSYSEENELF